MAIFNRRSDDPASHGIQNSGVINSGSGSMGNVQNQPGAFGSSQHQVNPAAGEEAAAQWPRLMLELARGLAAEEGRITELETCRTLLEVLRGLDVSGEQGQRTADGFLGQLAERCGGAPGIASIINSAISVVRTAMG